MRFSPDFIEKVRDANNIVDIISQHTEVSTRGGGTKALCPFPDHNEKTPSFSISEPKQVYYCFGCKKSGNLFNFLMEYNGMSFPEAVEYLASRASIEIPRDEKQEFKPQVDKKKFYKLNLCAGSHFKKTLVSLPQSHKAKAYLQKRGLTAETIDFFKIGYADESWDSLLVYLQGLKAPVFDAVKLGLVKKRNQGNGFFDLFRDRIMFPIISPRGDVVGFGGRIVDEGEPKYLNSHESPVFNKSKTLYGLYEAAKHIRTQDQVLVVEGYMDVISLYQNGIHNVVATLGTALTEGHSKLLRRSTQNVVVLFDGDEAGQAAQQKSLKTLLSEDLLPKGVVLPDGMDPDDYIRKYGTEKFQETVNSAQDLFFVVFQNFMKNYRPEPTAQVSIMNELAPLLECVESQSLKNLYIQKIAQDMGVEIKWILSFLREHKKKQAQAKVAPEEAPKYTEVVVPTQEKMDLSRVYKEELLLINLLLRDKGLLDEALTEGLLDEVSSPEALKAIQIIVNVYRQYPADFDKLTGILCSHVKQPDLVTMHLDENNFQQGDLKKLKTDCFQRVRDRFLKNRARQLAQELKTNRDPEKLEQFVKVTRERQALNHPKQSTEN